MFANYNDNTYLYASNRRRREIITRILQKTNADFSRDGDLFYKPVSEDELADVFDVEFWVDYDTGLPNTPYHWKVGTTGRNYMDGKIFLRFTEGVLPGWKIEEKNVCVNYIDINEIDAAKVVYVYKKRNNTVYSPPQRIEEDVSIDELLSLFEKYKRTNI